MGEPAGEEDGRQVVLTGCGIGVMGIGGLQLHGVAAVLVNDEGSVLNVGGGAVG